MWFGSTVLKSIQSILAYSLLLGFFRLLCCALTIEYLISSSNGQPLYECGLTFYHFIVQVRRCELKRGRRDPAAGADSSSHHSGAGQDSGFGSDSARIRIVQIEQQSGTSHHCLARPSHKSTITKNLNFIPFDIFLTASRLSVMTYACSCPPKTLSLDPPITPEKKELGDKVHKKPVLSLESLPRFLLSMYVLVFNPQNTMCLGILSWLHQCVQDWGLTQIWYQLPNSELSYVISEAQAITNHF